MEWLRSKLPSKSKEDGTQTDANHKAVVHHNQLSSGSMRLPKFEKFRSSIPNIGKKSINRRASGLTSADIQHLTPSTLPVEETSITSKEESSFSSEGTEEHIYGDVVNCHPNKDAAAKTKDLSNTRLVKRPSRKSKAPPPPLHDSMASKSVGGNAAKVHKGSTQRPKSRGNDDPGKTTQTVATITDDGCQTEPCELPLDIVKGFTNMVISQNSSPIWIEDEECESNQAAYVVLSSTPSNLSTARLESADSSNIEEDISQGSSDSDNEDTYTKSIDFDSLRTVVEDDPELPISPRRIEKTTSECIHLHSISGQSVISSRSYSAKDVTYSSNKNRNTHLICPEGDVLRPIQQSSVDFDSQSTLPSVYDISLEDQDVEIISMPKARKSPEQRFPKRKRQDAPSFDRRYEEYPHKHHTKDHRRTIDICEVFANQLRNNEDVVVESISESVKSPLEDNDVPGCSHIRKEDHTVTQLPTSSHKAAQEDANTTQTSVKTDEATNTNSKAAKNQSIQQKCFDEQHDAFAERCFEKILAVLNDLQEVKKEMKTFSGTEASDRDYVYMDEVMMRNLIKLDNIETKGNKDIKDERKKAIQTIQAMMLELERKLQENQEKQKNSATVTPGQFKNTDHSKEDNTAGNGSEETLNEVVTQK